MSQQPKRTDESERSHRLITRIAIAADRSAHRTGLGTQRGRALGGSPFARQLFRAIDLDQSPRTGAGENARTARGAS